MLHAWTVSGIILMAVAYDPLRETLHSRLLCVRPADADAAPIHVWGCGQAWQWPWQHCSAARFAPPKKR
eukprot:353000-Chlamydomonas_euryale.AAC.11